MTHEEFIEILDEKRYSYEIEGDKIVVTHNGWVFLRSLKTLPPGVVFKNLGNISLEFLTSLPPGVQFKNAGGVYLHSVKSIPPGVQFENLGFDVNLKSLIGWPDTWEGNIEGIRWNRLFNKMIELGLFDKRR